MAFDVWSQTNGCAASDLVATPRSGRRAWGVLYEIPADLIRGKRTDGRRTLTQIEGSRYEERSIRVHNAAGEEVEAATFLVKSAGRQAGLWTSSDYVGHIVSGLRAHQAPEEYVQRVIDIAVQTNNLTVQTTTEHTRLIEGLREPSAK